MIKKVIKINYYGCPLCKRHLYNVGDKFIRPWMGHSIQTIIDIDLKNGVYLCHSSLWDNSASKPTIKVPFSDDYRLLPVYDCNFHCKCCCFTCNACCNYKSKPIFRVGDRIKWTYDDKPTSFLVEGINLCKEEYNVSNGGYRFTIPFKYNHALTLVTPACPVSYCNPCCRCMCNC